MHLLYESFQIQIKGNPLAGRKKKKWAASLLDAI